MRVNTAESIETGIRVHARFGSWKAARNAADYVDGKFVVREGADGGADADGADLEAKPNSI
ncbi:hypothetical protein [Sphingomonas profundi]|uniref:hypothetical protein n=1 Tax=Alterirhizorhabdus profundi TaxID=2681549 RepID=UPI0012E81B29|nr:hypothetical protein [Sphingomonas profundi]